MNPPGARPAHLDPREAGTGQAAHESERAAERAAGQWRSRRAAARRVVAGRARDAADLTLLLDALELHPDADGASCGPPHTEDTSEQ